jgi:uncharacterized membrane protein
MQERRGLAGVGVALGVLVVLLGIALLGGFLFIPRMAGTPAAYYPFFPFGWFWGFFLVFIIFGVVRFLFLPWGWGWGYHRRYWYRYDESYRILRERYAKGEITKEQYAQMARDLDQHR